jgi:uncharacterized phiE125 gp8 family phage protein
MGTSVVTPPTEYPVSLDEAKSHVRVRHDEDDTYIEGLIKAATRHVENSLGMAMMARTLRLSQDTFTDNIELTPGPVSSVLNVKYYDENGDQQTLDPLSYTVDLSMPSSWVVRNDDYSWPDTLDGINAVTVDFVTGADALPNDQEDLKWAVLLIIAHFYYNRGDGNEPLPPALDAMLQNYRQIIV